jgi:hypothetical protein
LDKPHVTTMAMTWILNEIKNQQIIVLSFDWLYVYYCLYYHVIILETNKNEWYVVKCQHFILFQN